MGAQWLDFEDFVGPFGHPFFINVRTHPNLLNCNKHCAKTIFLQLLASHFGIKNTLQIYVFSRRDPGPHFFLILFASMSKNAICGPPSKSSGRANGIQNQPSGAKMLRNSSWWLCLLFFWNRLTPQKPPEVSRGSF